MKAVLSILLFAYGLLIFTSCNNKSVESKELSIKTTEQPGMNNTDLDKYQKATFAAGCFWCEEAVFESVKGVVEVVSGYSGGKMDNPTYEDVGSGNTGHAESFEVYYDSTLVNYNQLLRVYFSSQDPTQVDGQGPDEGAQYRSIIFYRNASEKSLAEKYINNLANSGKYDKPIITEILPFEKFWEAEAYHQDYVKHNPNNPYVQHESIQRLKRTQRQVKDLIKPEKSLIDR